MPVSSVVELGQTFFGNTGGNSGLSVLRTFRLLRILKLVRFMPNLRRQLVVMLRTMDNVAVFFSLLILFIFIFSILGMNLFGCKFCEHSPDGDESCDRKNFDSLLWALVTVFQCKNGASDSSVGSSATLELSSGPGGTIRQRHWKGCAKFCTLADGSRECTCAEIVNKAAYCVCDRKHFNNMLWATVTVFQRHERREREQRELAKKQQAMMRKYSECCSEDIYSSCSFSEQDSFMQSSQSQGSIPGSLKPPNLTVNNLSAPPHPLGRRASMNNGSRKDPTQQSLFQRRCSWKMSRNSLKKKPRTGSDPDEDQSVVLNNNNHLMTSPLYVNNPAFQV
ncbi:unnamed protein product [Nesidiocoris tenuis]|uniref:Ion transport domain-containing protein n=1 Tax=Nesidiocoris tenuis TaxID=355587 RepID=A0A6H5HAR6_9HEMI|nr:unnamed protein product [Nesidiocoris tenuis]